MLMFLHVVEFPTLDSSGGASEHAQTKQTVGIIAPRNSILSPLFTASRGNTARRLAFGFAYKTNALGWAPEVSCGRGFVVTAALWDAPVRFDQSFHNKPQTKSPKSPKQICWTGSCVLVSNALKFTATSNFVFTEVM